MFNPSSLIVCQHNSVEKNIRSETDERIGSNFDCYFCCAIYLLVWRTAENSFLINHIDGTKEFLKTIDVLIDECTKASQKI